MIRIRRPPLAGLKYGPLIRRLTGFFLVGVGFYVRALVSYMAHSRYIDIAG